VVAPPHHRVREVINVLNRDIPVRAAALARTTIVGKLYETMLPAVPSAGLLIEF
jgi:hypothetical protein